MSVTARPWPRFHLEWWHYVALAFLLLQITFAAVPRIWPGTFGMVCWYFGSDLILWGGIVLILGTLAVAWSAWRRPFWTRGRVVGFGLLALLALAPLTYGAYPSSHTGEISKVRFRVPLDGPVTVAWGGNTTDVNYHVIAPDQRWAYDIVATDDAGKTFRDDGQQVEDYHIYDRPVLAPADGVVITITDGDPDMPIGELGGGSNPGGNYIDLRVAAGEFIHLAHLKPGSIQVTPGDNVVVGQELARVGNSGNTSEPHLHVHLQDDPEFGEGVPLYFYDYRSGDKIIRRGMPRGGIELVGDDVQWNGEVIEHAGSNGSGGSDETSDESVPPSPASPDAPPPEP